MAQTNVTNQQSGQNAGALQQRGAGQNVSRRGLDPIADFFSANPFALMRRMQEEMDRNLTSLFSGGQSSSGGAWLPAIEVKQHDGELQVCAELAGLKPEDVQVEITEGALVIQGERRFEDENRSGGAYRSERRYGSFYREIPLPEGAQAEQAKAHFENGVLEVDVPISQQSNQRRRIEITGADGPTANQAESAQRAASGASSSAEQAGGAQQSGESASSGASAAETQKGGKSAAGPGRA